MTFERIPATGRSSGASAQQIHDRNSALIPGGTASSARWVKEPLVIERTSGAILSDVDGRDLVDFNSAFGAILTGHCDPRQEERVRELSAGLDMAGIGSTRLEGELAERLVDAIPCAEMVGFCCSGTEATFHALRVARASTGRRCVVKFQGAYHGWHDYLATNYLSAADNIGKADPLSAGTLPEAAEATIVLPFNDVEALESLLGERGHEIAAIIIEPIMHNIGSLKAEPEFLQALRRLTERDGIVLIFDEIITGIRHGLGGYQAICGVTPDLATFGKALGNGYPISIVTGKTELMQRFRPGSLGGDVLLGGTFNGHPIAVAAAMATMERMEEAESYPRLYALGDQLAEGLADAARAADVTMQVAHFGSIVSPLFMAGQARSYEDMLGYDAHMDLALRQGLLKRGYACTATPLRRFALNLAHEESHITGFCEAAFDTLKEARGLRPSN